MTELFSYDEDAREADRRCDHDTTWSHVDGETICDACEAVVGLAPSPLGEFLSQLAGVVKETLPPVEKLDYLRMKLSQVDRVEVIDEQGRAYVRHDLSLEAQLQDGGRTLKLFVTNKEGQ